MSGSPARKQRRKAQRANAKGRTPGETRVVDGVTQVWCGNHQKFEVDTRVASKARARAEARRVLGRADVRGLPNSAQAHQPDIPTG